MKRRTVAALLALLTIFLSLPLAGCSIESGDGLASLPKLPGEYLALQKKMDDILAQNYTPAVAESGANRQAVQQQDIDGDGEAEIVSFFRSTTSGEYMVYLHKKVGDEYVELGHAKGYGKYLREVSYPRNKANGARAIALSWGMEDNSSYGLSVHTLTAEGLSDALTIKYSTSYIADLNGDGVDEIVLTMFDRLSNSMSLTAYGFSGDACAAISQAPLSADVKSVVRITRDMGPQGGHTLYVDSLVDSGGYITDIVDLQNGALRNTTLGSDSKRSANTWRPVSILCRDIDNDGVPEVPLAEMMPGYYDPNSADTRWRLRWTKFRDGAAAETAVTTFHSPTEDWYLRWPDSWGSAVSVVKKNEAGILKTTFLVPVEGAGRDEYLAAGDGNVLLNIWVFTGDNRKDYFSTSGMKKLKSSENAIYAYSIPQNAYPDLTPTDEDVARAFNAIAREWGSEGYN